MDDAGRVNASVPERFPQVTVSLCTTDAPAWIACRPWIP